jgi:transcriptional regulator with XRE-family HTH domain
MTPSAGSQQDTRTDALSAVLGRSIRLARKDCGLTQQDLAHKVGITVRSVSGWECGKAIPHLGTLTALAHALGREPDLFIAPARAVSTGRRAERVSRVADRIEGALTEVARRIRVGG